jgi:hypothetical protein
VLTEKVLAFALKRPNQAQNRPSPQLIDPAIVKTCITLQESYVVHHGLKRRGAGSCFLSILPSVSGIFGMFIYILVCSICTDFDTNFQSDACVSQNDWTYRKAGALSSWSDEALFWELLLLLLLLLLMIVLCCDIVL